MPDAHVGIGATVGSVIPTADAVIPSAVGVDIGCGMIAAELDVTEDQLPDSLEPFLGRSSRVIPAGVGRGHDAVADHGDALAGARTGRRPRSPEVRRSAPPSSSVRSVQGTTSSRSASTSALGSGSCCTPAAAASATSWRRGTSARRASSRRSWRSSSKTRTWRTSRRARRVRRVHPRHAVGAGLRAANRADDGRRDRELFAFVGAGRETQRINCHHNFTQREVHDGRELWITRKGAIKADVGDVGVIPGSMGTRSYIVNGQGQRRQLQLVLTRRGSSVQPDEGKAPFTEADLAEQMTGKAWMSSRAGALLDEIPSAYKDIDQVMADQADLVEIRHTLSQVLNYKGT